MKSPNNPRFRLHGLGQTGPKNLLSRHSQAALYSLGQMFEKPLQGLLTAMVIGIALSLPAVAFVLVNKVQVVASEWGTVEISVFCQTELNNQQAKALANDMRSREDIANLRFISKETAREEFRLHSGFREAVDIIGDNVFPATIVVQPHGDIKSQEVQALMDDLRQYEGVDIVQLDQRWVEKLFSWIDVIELAIWIFGLLLSTTVILIVGNTIRLEINNRREEIEVVKLVGATNAFVRRPFLYLGLWQGLAGGLLALILVLTTMLFIGDSLDDLAATYDKDIDLGLLELVQFVLILMGGMLLGWLGSWLAVGQHLRRIEPS